MDTYDYRIIRELQKDGRMTNQALSERINLSPSPCLKRLRDLETSGVITGYSATVDQSLYGLPITAFLRIKLSSHADSVVQTFESSVQEIDEVLDCFLIAGDADYLLRVIAKSLEAYEQFVRTRIQVLSSVASIDTSFAYGNVKRATMFPPLSPTNS